MKHYKKNLLSFYPIIVIIILAGIICNYGNVYSYPKYQTGIDSLESEKIRIQAALLDSVGYYNENTLAEYDSAMYCYRQALTLRLNIQDSLGIAASYENIGFTYNKKASYDSAIAFHRSSLEIRRALNAQEEIAQSYNNLGELYQLINDYSTSNAYLDSSIEILNKLNLKIYTGNPLTTKGLNYNLLGQPKTALDYHNQSLQLFKEISDTERIGVVYTNLGFDYYKLKQYKSSIRAYQNALRLLKGTNPKYYGITQGNLSLAYNAQGKYQKAILYADSALHSAQQYNSDLDIGASYYKLGTISADAKKYQKAADYFNLALITFQQIGTREREGMVYYQLMRLSEKTKNKSLAVFYGKMSVNILQEIRSKIKDLNEDVQRDYLGSKESVYRKLASILIDEGRLDEAEYVLTMLKEEEFFDFVRSGETGGSLSTKIGYNTNEQIWKDRFTQIKDSLGAISKEYNSLRKKKKLNKLTPEGEGRFKILEEQIQVSNKNLNSFYQQLSEDSKSWTIGEIKQNVSALQSILTNNLGEDYIALWTLVGEDKYRVLMITSWATVPAEYSIKQNVLNDKVIEFRKLLTNPKENPKPLAKELYNILLKPIMKNVTGTKAKTILWVLDGVLRYLPVNALHDGKGYLLERFANVIITPVSMPIMGKRASGEMTALGLGVSKSFGNFLPLPYVADELKHIIKNESVDDQEGILTGEIKLDDQFTRDEMFASLQKSYPLVHIATHFKFQPGDNRNSFMLMGDGSHLTLDALSVLVRPFEGIELLTLSACNTAVGGGDAKGNEFESFAGSAQMQGAKAVIATLWPVPDRSTPRLMKTFYQLWTQNKSITKAEALRQAQYSLLHGRLPKEKPDKTIKPQFAHPFYWAPFVLIGNCR